jgi:lipopolysaccharide biosynthesis protein
MTKRICLFAGFHPKNQVSDYVVHYAWALSQLADVYYLADCEMPENELAKLAPYTQGAWGYRHGKYDFGSWQELIHKLGWERVRKYDECIFANDSVFAPLFPLQPLVEKGTALPVDAWSINAYEHEYLESYFYVLKNRVLQSPFFENFMEIVTKQASVNRVIVQYEHGLTHMLRVAGFSYKAFASFYNSAADEWRQCIRLGLPVLKTKVFTKYRVYVEYEWLPGWRKFLKKHTDYSLELIDQHLRSLDIDPQQFDTWCFWCKSVWWTLRRWRQKWFRVHFHQKVKIILLFGIPFMDNTAKPPTKYPVDTID